MKWFWHAVDTGGVLCQLVFYPIFVGAGLLMAITGAPTTVYRALGSEVETLWIATIIVSPFVVLLGSQIPNRFSGISLELGANVTLAGTLWCYAVAVMQSAWLDKGAFSPWLAVGIANLVLLICVRDFRRLLRAERRARNENRS